MKQRMSLLDQRRKDHQTRLDQVVKEKEVLTLEQEQLRARHGDARRQADILETRVRRLLEQQRSYNDQLELQLRVLEQVQVTPIVQSLLQLLRPQGHSTPVHPLTPGHTDSCWTWIGNKDIILGTFEHAPPLFSMNRWFRARRRQVTKKPELDCIKED